MFYLGGCRVATHRIMMGETAQEKDGCMSIQDLEFPIGVGIDKFVGSMLVLERGDPDRSNRFCE